MRFGSRRDHESFIGSYDPEHEMPDPDRDPRSRYMSDAYRNNADDSRFMYRWNPDRIESRHERTDRWRDDRYASDYRDRAPQSRYGTSGSYRDEYDRGSNYGGGDRNYNSGGGGGFSGGYDRNYNSGGGYGASGGYGGYNSNYNSGGGGYGNGSYNSSSGNYNSGSSSGGYGNTGWNRDRGFDRSSSDRGYDRNFEGRDRYDYDRDRGGNFYRGSDAGFDRDRMGDDYGSSYGSPRGRDWNRNEFFDEDRNWRNRGR